MLIASILIALTLILQIVTLSLVLYLVRRIKNTENSNAVRFQRAMDRVVALEPERPMASQPNEAVESPDLGQELDENIPWDIPKDVKITVEGGDTLAPPGFEVSNG